MTDNELPRRVTWREVTNDLIFGRAAICLEEAVNHFKANELPMDFVQAWASTLFIACNQQAERIENEKQRRQAYLDKKFGVKKE